MCNEHGVLRGVRSNVVVKVIRNFHRCLKGDLKTEWDNAVSSKLATGAEAPAEFWLARWEMGKAVLEDHPWENQMEYMKKTKKSKDFSVTKYINRLKHMNSCTKYMESGTTKMSSKYMVRTVVSRMLPLAWAKKLELVNGPQLATLLKACKVLQVIERAERKREERIS